MRRRHPDATGRRVLVTGGASGFGQAIARVYAARGDHVLVTDLAAEPDPAVLPAATGDGEVVYLQLDIRDEVAWEKAESWVVEHWGGLDVLVNNAGVGIFRNVADMDVAAWHDVIDTNMSGVFYCCHAAISHMKRRGGGWIINISSLAGKNPFPGGAAYCASKAAVNAFSEALMQEVRHDNIRVSYVMPGSVATGFSGGESPSGPAADWKLSPDDVAEVVVDLIRHPARSLPSRVELRPSRPPKR